MMLMMFGYKNNNMSDVLNFLIKNKTPKWLIWIGVIVFLLLSLYGLLPKTNNLVEVKTTTIEKTTSYLDSNKHLVTEKITTIVEQPQIIKTTTVLQTIKNNISGQVKPMMCKLFIQPDSIDGVKVYKLI